MASLSGLAIGLGCLFAFVVSGLVAEVYYLLWWKKRCSRTRDEEIGEEDDKQESVNNTHFAPSLLCWWKKGNPQSTTTKALEGGGGAEEGHKGNKSSSDHVQEVESVDCELMRLHNLGGPPRFLFTINEETKEDMESEISRKGSRTRSLSDLIIGIDQTPLITPLSSPPLKPQNLDSYFDNGVFNPLFEADFSRVRSSPPPTFKFLRDAEEKLLRRLMAEAERRGIKKDGYSEKEGSFVKLVLGKKVEEEVEEHGEILHHHQYHQLSRVIPLTTSPSPARRPIDQQK